MNKPIFDSLAEALLKGFNPPDEHYIIEVHKPLGGKPLPIGECEGDAGVTAKAKLGRSRSERIDRQFNSHEEAMAYMQRHQVGFLQNVSNNLHFAESYLVDRNLPVEVPQDKTELFSNLFDLIITNIEHGGYGFEHDSFEALAARFIMHITEMLDQELDEIARLEHAVAFGHVTTLWDHYQTVRIAQEKNAKKPRDPLLSSIYSKLAKRKLASNLTPKELWQDFVSILEVSKQKFEKVTEIQVNKNNPATWEVRFCRILGEEVNPEERVTYKQFRNALNRKNAR
uniref:Uncharacterized protein n=1 Tax=Rheinheimera sp. BAL341 TaxID=1708203 RepID=A0A486XFS4_9GAMM